ncbi:prosaposin-like [Mugil cephalus]|uniref:prosaposin-like n=1 Tax=Mugil cephalus TaxID=48193 RepID=UPI001FB76EE9|nr:prosaposin-like [Mugil cephalus]
MTMSPVVSVALLLLSTAAVESWKALEDQTEKEEGNCRSHPRHTVGVENDHHEVQILQDRRIPGFCSACKSIVSKVQKKLGNDSSKVKIRDLLHKVCCQMKIQLIVAACKKIVSKYSDKLIDLIAKHTCPRNTCVKLKLCKRNSAVS